MSKDRKLKIMFVCLGNICRSPMAEFVMRDELSRRHLDHIIEVSSGATSYEEYGNPVYPPAVQKMKREGVTIYPHRATPIVKEDYDRYDMFIGMEDYNLRRMRNSKNIIGVRTEERSFSFMDTDGMNKGANEIF